MSSVLPDGSVVVVTMEYGSHVYGTDLPTSDRDVKGVFLPPGNDILLQKAQDTIVRSTKQDASKANTPLDVDTEFFSLQRFLGLLLEGQTNAIDMLFTPESHYLGAPHPAWLEIRRERGRFLHSGVTMFARYCRQQAAKYGIKGSRVAALRAALELLEPLHDHDKLELHLDRIKALADAQAAASEGGARHLRLVSVEEAAVNRTGLYLEVAGRKVPMGATVKLARATLKRVFDEFGQRALLAEQNQGVDWKALMHAVRVAKQAEELLLTGNVTFPRPEKSALLSIRKGELRYETVAEMIEAGVVDMEKAALKSKLPVSPDRAFADELICRHYSSQIRPV